MRGLRPSSQKYLQLPRFRYHWAKKHQKVLQLSPLDSGRTPPCSCCPAPHLAHWLRTLRNHSHSVYLHVVQFFGCICSFFPEQGLYFLPQTVIVLEQILVIGLELSERRPGQILKRTAVSLQTPSGLLAREGCCPLAGSWEQGAASPSLESSSESWGLAFLIHQIAPLKVAVSSSSSQDPHFVIDCQDCSNLLHRSDKIKSWA